LPGPAEKYCPGKKRIFQGGKENSLGKFFFHFSIPGIEKWKRSFPREFSFPPSNILFFPRQYCSAEIGNGNFSPG
jgi:hypothetical protein